MCTLLMVIGHCISHWTVKLTDHRCMKREKEMLVNVYLFLRNHIANWDAAIVERNVYTPIVNIFLRNHIANRDAAGILKRNVYCSISFSDGSKTSFDPLLQNTIREKHTFMESYIFLWTLWTDGQFPDHKTLFVIICTVFIFALLWPNCRMYIWADLFPITRPHRLGPLDQRCHSTVYSTLVVVLVLCGYQLVRLWNFLCCCWVSSLGHPL